MKKKKQRTKEQIAIRVSLCTITGNILLTIYKLIAGFLGQSAAMISDAIHSLSDVISTLIVMAGIKIAGKESDKIHPYGHERYESVAAIILAFMLFATGIGIGYGGLKTILAGNYSAIAIPGKIALIAAIVSIATKEAMYWYTRVAAKKTNSGALMADAWHHRSDALSSIGSFVGIFGSRLGYPVLDSVACLVICIFIVKVSIDIFRDAVSKMIDKACDAETEERIKALIRKKEGVIGIDRLKTRMFGDKIYMDVEIRIDRDVPLHISHDIAHNVHDAIEEQFPSVKHCMVHVNPTKK